jgi:hypothetical protein
MTNAYKTAKQEKRIAPSICTDNIYIRTITVSLTFRHRSALRWRYKIDAEASGDKQEFFRDFFPHDSLWVYYFLISYFKNSLKKKADNSKDGPNKESS